MTIITKKGDRGMTFTYAGEKISKTDPIIMLNGAIDGLNAQVGFARSLLTEASLLNLARELREIQGVLFRLGAEIQGATDHIVNQHDVEGVEERITEHESSFDLPRSFITPGAMPASAAIDFARAVARRVEREAIGAAEKGIPVSEDARIWLNRVSDYLFIAARAAEYEAGIEFDTGE
jgi:cob(I)alamin adenosyltransferase